MKRNFWKDYFGLIAEARKRAEKDPSEGYVVWTSIMFGWLFILTSHDYLKKDEGNDSNKTNQ